MSVGLAHQAVIGSGIRIRGKLRYMVTRFRYVILPPLLFAVSCLTALVAGPNIVSAGNEGKFAEAKLSSSPKTVVELFTSQGCSSCPKADALLSELAKRDDILALSWSVDYWDYMGWKDTLARPEHADRQRDYNRALGLSGVYTPQIIVGGEAQAIGSRRDEVMSLIGATQSVKSKHKAPKLSLAIKDHLINVSLTKSKLKGSASLWLVGYNYSRDVTINHGENTGKTLTYHNSVVWSSKLGSWTGGSLTVSAELEPLESAGADAYAILVQHDETGRIIATAEAELPKRSIPAGQTALKR